MQAQGENDADGNHDGTDWDRLLALAATTEAAARRARLLAGHDFRSVSRQEDWLRETQLMRAIPEEGVDADIFLRYRRLKSGRRFE